MGIWWWSGGLEHDWIMTFHSVGNVIIPTDELIFFRGVGQPPTSFLFRGNYPKLAELFRLMKYDHLPRWFHNAKMGLIHWRFGFTVSHIRKTGDFIRVLTMKYWDWTIESWNYGNNGEFVIAQVPFVGNIREFSTTVNPSLFNCAAWAQEIGRANLWI